LRDFELVKLENSLSKDLINMGIKQAGNLNKLCKSINMSYPSFLYLLRGQSELISIKKLKLLSAYLEIDFDYFNDKIVEIRKCKIPSIKNPKFPFNLASTAGATLLGNITSDGCIYVDKKSRGILRTKYSAGTNEELSNFIINVENIFGDIHFQKEQIRKSIYLKIGTSVVAESLVRVGAPVGNKTLLDCEVPWLIKQGSNEMKVAYLKAVFDDEGCVGCSYKPYITISRTINIDRYVSLGHKKLLKQVEPYFQERVFPTGHKIKSIDLSKLKKVTSLNTHFIHLINWLYNIRPKLLHGESELLNSLNIQHWIRNYNLSLTEKNGYALKSEIRISRKLEVINFYNQINFGLSAKSQKLKNSLISNNWI
jgi:transcriptional regulator with XRE-family HTH domain